MREMVAALLSLCLMSAASAQSIKIEDIRAQLFYENKGTWSFDLTKRPDAALWNTMIGEGDAGGSANSFLVSVVLRSKPDSFVENGNVLVKIIDDNKKKTIVEHRFGSLYFGEGGLLHKPILVEDRVCDPITIVVQTKTETKSARLPFACGE